MSAFLSLKNMLSSVLFFKIYPFFAAPPVNGVLIPLDMVGALAKMFLGYSVSRETRMTILNPSPFQTIVPVIPPLLFFDVPHLDVVHSFFFSHLKGGSPTSILRSILSTIHSKPIPWFHCFSLNERNVQMGQLPVRNFPRSPLQSFDPIGRSFPSVTCFSQSSLSFRERM